MRMEGLYPVWMQGENNTGTRQLSPKPLPDFQRSFPNEEACRTYLYTARPPNGFVCSYCGWIGKPIPKKGIST